MQIYKHFYGTISALAFCLSPSVGYAFEITGVNAPDLLLPPDGNRYKFDIFVTGTYTAGDFKFAPDPERLVAVEYWDEDFPFIKDQPIDLTGVLRLPIGGGAAPGLPWGPISVSFKVGCDLANMVNGPSGKTDEGPVMNDGYFQFMLGVGSIQSSWGYNTVECTTTPPPPPPIPVKALKEVPAPLPFLGIGVAFSYARRIRRRSKINHC